MVLFIMLNEVILSKLSSLWKKILKYDHTNEGYRAVLSYGTVYHMLNKVVLTFK